MASNWLTGSGREAFSVDLVLVGEVWKGVASAMPAERES